MNWLNIQVVESGGKGLGAKRVLEADDGSTLTSRICEDDGENLFFSYCVEADFANLPFPVNRVRKFAGRIHVEPISANSSMVYYIGFWEPHGDQTNVVETFGNLYDKLLETAAELIVDEPRRQMQTQGFTKITVFTPAEVAELRGIYERIENQLPGRRFPAQMHNVHMRDPDVWKFVSHPNLVRLVQLATGVSKLHILASTFCTKHTDPKGTFGWHQDVHYWDLNPPVSYASWIALDPVTPESGCVEFIPNPPSTEIHHEHVYDSDADNLLLSKKAVNSETLNISSKVCVELEPGEMTIHDGWTVHGSSPNLSGRRRAGLAINWMPASAEIGPSREGYGDLSDGALIEEFRVPVDPAHGFPPKVLQRPHVHQKFRGRRDESHDDAGSRRQDEL